MYLYCKIHFHLEIVLRMFVVKLHVFDEVLVGAVRPSLDAEDRGVGGDFHGVCQSFCGLVGKDFLDALAELYAEFVLVCLVNGAGLHICLGKEASVFFGEIDFGVTVDYIFKHVGADNADTLVAQLFFEVIFKIGGSCDALDAFDDELGGGGLVLEEVVYNGEAGQIVADRFRLDKCAFALADHHKAFFLEYEDRSSDRDEADAEAFYQIFMGADRAALGILVLQNLFFEDLDDLFVHGNRRVFVYHSFILHSFICGVIKT